MLRLRVEEALASIYDPEIPVNIYELGLIYSVEVGADGKVTVKMTLTAPGCPAAQSLPVEVERKIAAIAEVSDIQVEVVWDPPWGPDRMSEAARLQLGLL
jgi:FeS assembly SUF system protein